MIAVKGIGIALVLVAAMSTVGAVAGTPHTKVHKPIESTGAKGYWFYLFHHAPAPKPRQTKATQSHHPRKPAHACAKQKTWKASCGFITPKSFAFQSRERDALLHRMVMHPGSPKAVAAFQFYIRWVVNQSIYASQVWQYNRLHNTALDPDAYAPISRYGLQLASSIQGRGHKAVWAALRRWGAILVVFTKQDCQWCHAQSLPLSVAVAATGLPLYDASLAGACLAGFTTPAPGGTTHCIAPTLALRPASMLHVTVVPSIFLWLPKNMWIRVGAGLTTADLIQARMYNFFVAWRTAATTGHETGHTGMDLNPADAPPTLGALRQILSNNKPGASMPLPGATK